MALGLQFVKISRILQEARDMAAKRIESGRLTLEADCASDVGAAGRHSADERALYNLVELGHVSVRRQNHHTEGSLRGDEIIIEVDDSSGLATSSRPLNTAIPKFGRAAPVWGLRSPAALSNCMAGNLKSTMIPKAARARSPLSRQLVRFPSRHRAVKPDELQARCR